MSNQIQLLAHSLAVRIPALAQDSPLNNAYLIEKEVEEAIAPLKAVVKSMTYPAGGYCRKESVKPLVEALRNIAENYDCDHDAHKYGTRCRTCDAVKALEYAKTIGL